MARERVLTITQKDLRMDLFRAGGKGGQKQNKTETGVRFRHDPSGAVAESREHTTQLQNKRAAFHRLVETAEMQSWIRKRAAEAALSAAERVNAERRIAESVSRAMHPSNLKVEVRDDGRWVEVTEDSCR